MKKPDRNTLIRHSQAIPYDQWGTETLDELGTEKAEALMRAQEHRLKLRHRGYWSSALIFIMVLLNVVSLFVVVAIGARWLTYDTPYAVPAVITANFAETWVLAKIAVKFYFDANKDE